MLDFGAGVGTTFNPKLNLFGLSGDTSSAYSPGQFVNLRMGYRFNRFVSAAVYYQWGYLKPNSSWDIDPSGIYLHDVGMDLRGYLTPNTRAGFQASFGLRMGWGRFAVNDATLFYGSSSVNADYHVNSVVITPVSVDLGYRFALGGDRYGTIGLLTEISFWRPHSAEYCEDSTCVSTEEGDLEVPGAEKSFSLGMHASWVF